MDADADAARASEAGLAESTTILGIEASRKSPLVTILKISVRWLIVFAIVASIYAVLAHYSSLAAMPRAEKHQFNAIITGLSIALGLTMESCLSSMVADLRWWVLARRYRSRRKIDLILQADSMPHLIMMALRSRRGTIHVAVITWAVILLAAQIAVASLGLCYSTDTADTKALLSPGQIYAPNLTAIQAGGLVAVKSSSLGAQQYTANSYGIISTGLVYSTNFSDVPEAGTLVQPTDPVVFCPSTCRYVFGEVSVKSVANDDVSPVTVRTSRSIDSSAQCQSSRVKTGGDGNATSITVEGPRGDFTVDLPRRIGSNMTIFMTDTSESCGEGCSPLTVFEASDKTGWYYTCNSTVHQVVNATMPSQYASDQLRAMAAAAIALQGYSASSFDTDVNKQFQTYPAESVFGTPANGSTDDMSAAVSRFSIGVMAIGSTANDPLTVNGMAPQRGIVLNITHPQIVLAILGIILAVVLLLEITLAVWAHRVVVPHNGPFIMSQILKPMTTHPYYKNAHRYKSEFMSLRKPSSQKLGEPLWRYSCTPTAKAGVYDLHMEELKREGEEAETSPSVSDSKVGGNDVEMDTVQKPSADSAAS